MKEFKNSYTAIVCVNNNGFIAKDGKLLYRIKADLENFKSLTSGNVVVMGRNTFESLGCKPLKDRVNIIVTTREDYFLDGDEELYKDTYVCASLEEVDDLCWAYFGDKQLFIIGGGVLYHSAFDEGIIDKAIVTLVNDDTEGDVCFPDLWHDERFKTVFKTTSLSDHPNDLYYRYIVYKKK